MQLYESIARHIEPHRARSMAAFALRLASFSGRTKLPVDQGVDVMGLRFPGVVGLAAGFDKHGDLYPYLQTAGFGFAEIGTVTPLPEPGRSRGIHAVTDSLARHIHRRRIPLGISISMNRATQPQSMAQDYLSCLHAAWQHADYIVINLGVRAGPDLHLSEHRNILGHVLNAVRKEREWLFHQYGNRLPMMIKIDQARGSTHELVCMGLEAGMDGIVLCGSGSRPTDMLAQVATSLNNDIPIVAVGGIRTPQDAADRLMAGASLIQVHTGLVQSGPGLIRQMNAFLRDQGNRERPNRDSDGRQGRP
jgi:dihydroorotate dehydrogenase